MNFLFSLSGLILGITCLLLAFILLVYRKTKLHLIWLFFNLAVAIWGFGCFLIGRQATVSSAIAAWRFAEIGVIFISVFFFHTVVVLCDVEKRFKKIVVFAYLQGFFFLFLNTTPLFVSKARVVFGSLYYVQNAGLFYPIFSLIWVSLVIWGHFILFMHYRRSYGNRRNQILYFFIGMLLGFSGGITNFFPMFKIDIYPLGNFTIPLYCFIVTYAILKYRLMDIRIVITRAGIFLAVYAFILGLPFWLGFKLLGAGLWIMPASLMVVFATAGPIIYNYLRRRTEEVLLKEQRRYQKVLRELGNKMSQIRKEMSRILKAVVEAVHQEINPEFVAIYTYSKTTKRYALEDKYPQENFPFLDTIPDDFSLVQRLDESRGPVIINDYSEGLKMFHEMLAVSFFIEKGLFGFLILGPKPKKALYTQDDIETFRILSHQVSLAIENCLFWQKEQVHERARIHEQIRRQKSMDHFSASMAHEILNPVSGVIGTIEGLKMTIKEDWEKTISSDKEEYLNQKLTRSVNNLMRITKMIDAVKEFSRETDGDFIRLKLDKVVEDFLYMFEPQLKFKEIKFIKDVEPNIYVRGNKIHLEEVLLNLGNNAIHAVETARKPEERAISLKIHKDTPGTCLITFKDNGYGVKEEFLEDIFLDFVTTKASTEGTGMGLARARKIIENHKGKIWVESGGEGQGAEFFVRLPLGDEG